MEIFHAGEDEDLELTFRFIPDAFIKDDDQDCLVVFEVEDTSELKADKLRAYTRLWFELDYIEWGLTLISVDKYMHERTVPLEVFAYTKFLSARMPPSTP